MNGLAIARDFQPTMTESEYTAEVSAVLNQHSAEARARLARLPGLLPENAKAMEITIFVDQMGEGFLTVRVALTGPDLHVLNKAIGEAAVLFETKMVKDELVPPLPLMDPFEEEFAVEHALADCAVVWLVEVWEGVDRSGFRVPVSIVSHEGCGTKAPVKLLS